MEISLRSGEFIRPLGSCDTTDGGRVSFLLLLLSRGRLACGEEEGPHKKYTSPVVNNWEEVFLWVPRDIMLLFLHPSFAAGEVGIGDGKIIGRCYFSYSLVPGISWTYPSFLYSL